MKIIGFRYCDRTKNYFCDKHESDENVRNREQFIKEYFKYELDSYRWIHLPEDVAKDLEKKDDNQLLENVFFGFEKNGIKMREYHVDTHASFCDQNKFK